MARSALENGRLQHEARQAALIRDRHSNVSVALERLAASLNIPNEKKWAASQHRKINRSVARKRHNKLRQWHLKNKRPRSKAEEAPIPKSILQAVFLKSEQRNKRSDFEQLVTLSKQVTLADLRPVQRRAAELLNGAKLKPKQNLIEKEAMKLASSLRASVSKSNKVGRPEGSAPNKVTMNELNYQVPLSIVDICSAAAPILEEILGHQITISGWDLGPAKDNPAFDVLVATIRTEIPSADPATVAQAIYRRRKAAGAQ